MCREAQITLIELNGDTMGIRAVQFRRMQPFTNTHFERNFGINGPHHHPLLVTLPKWHAPQIAHFRLNRIDRFAMRQAYHAQMDNWIHFEASARQP